MKTKLLLLLLFAGLIACTSSTKKTSEFRIEYEKFELENGLDVIFHIDRSDPVVAVGISVHAGSANEKPGRTGFAHLFEHLHFLESEHLGKGGLDQLSARVGGAGANGYTTNDHTNYFQTVPKDALEKMLWAEADHLGWFINTITVPVLEKEKQVVKNEKRQWNDNAPYGHTSYVIDKNLFGKGHPYSWQVIGSLEDLQNATLDDVREFFGKWYVPNNITLFLSGDFDTAQAKAWVHKYFDEIAQGEDIVSFDKQPVKLEETIHLVHEDNFANLPELTLVWPTVEALHPDAYALDILISYLSKGKKAPLYQTVVEEKKLSSKVSMWQYNGELAGKTQLSVRAFEEIDLDSVYKAIREGFARFEADGINEKDLERIKTLREVDYYNQFSTVENKGLRLAQLNNLSGDPSNINKNIRNLLNVTRDDVMRVYETYIKDKNYVAASFVPKNADKLALQGSLVAEVMEEDINTNAGSSFDATQQASFEKTPSDFDRSAEPPYGDPPEITIPDIWEDSLSNGIKILGIENNEVPLTFFAIIFEGGQLLDDINKPGIANLTINLLTKGTEKKTPLELEEALQQLGTRIYFDSGQEDAYISGYTLARNFTATISLLEEILLYPRWDKEEFELAKQSVLSSLQEQAADPNSIASNEFKILLYGEENILAKNKLGTEQSVKEITLEDLKQFYRKSFTPVLTNIHVVGAVDKPAVLKSLKGLEANWEVREVKIPEYVFPDRPDKASLYFYNIPDAKQSVFRIGYPALAKTDPEFYPATVMNFILGGGGFVSQLVHQVRDIKGYTYGIRSEFDGGNNAGPFSVRTSVQTLISLEASQLIRDILEHYPSNFTSEDLATTRSSLIKSNARAFEQAWAKINILEDISKYGFAYDYLKTREKIVQEMSVERIRELAEKYIDPDQMIWLVVGDAKTQLPRMKELGYGDPVLLNK